MITFRLFSYTLFFIMVSSVLADELAWQFIVNSGPLYVVTSFRELPKFYSELRIQNPQIITPLSPNMKDDICYRTHHHFERAMEWLKPENHQSELLENGSGIFEELFQVVERDTLPTELSSPDDETDNDHQDNEQPMNEPLPFRLSEDDDDNDNDAQGSQCTSTLSTDRDEGPTFRYTNSSRYRRFLIDEEVGDAAEITFVCLVRNLRTGEIQPYYVSDFAYDVNDARATSRAMRFEGRFIFYDNRIRALAEEQPIQRGADIFEVVMEAAYYAERHSGRVPAIYAKDDPVCGLDEGRKLRLCTSICMYNMSGCRTQVVVDEECERVRFLLGNLWYHEWALGCNMGNENHNIHRKVSRGYSDNEAFVFTVDDNERLSSRYSLVKVSVIIDSGANN